MYEVATFYEITTRADRQVQDHDLHNLPCALQSATMAAEHLKHKLVWVWRTTPDGMFTLKEGECMERAATRRCCCQQQADVQLDAPGSTRRLLASFARGQR